MRGFSAGCPAAGKVPKKKKKKKRGKMEAGAPSVCLTVSQLPPLASPLIFNKQQLRLSATGPTVCPDKNDNKEGANKKQKDKQNGRKKNHNCWKSQSESKNSDRGHQCNSICPLNRSKKKKIWNRFVDEFWLWWAGPRTLTAPLSKALWK